MIFTRSFMLQILANLIAGMIVIAIAYFIWNRERAEPQ